VKSRGAAESLHSDKPPRISDVRGPRLGLLPIVWVGIFLSMFQQFVGINVIFYYSTSLWQSVGLSENDAFLTSVSRRCERGADRSVRPSLLVAQSIRMRWRRGC